MYDGKQFNQTKIITCTGELDEELLESKLSGLGGISRSTCSGFYRHKKSTHNLKLNGHYYATTNYYNFDCFQVWQWEN